MKRFLAVYTGTPGAMARWDALSESERERRTAQGMGIILVPGIEVSDGSIHYNALFVSDPNALRGLALHVEEGAETRGKIAALAVQSKRHGPDTTPISSEWVMGASPSTLSRQRVSKTKGSALRAEPWREAEAAYAFFFIACRWCRLIFIFFTLGSV